MPRAKPGLKFEAPKHGVEILDLVSSVEHQHSNFHVALSLALIQDYMHVLLCSLAVQVCMYV